MPDTKQTAAKKIDQRRRDLLQRGFNIGTAKSDVLSAGYGGWYQEFQKGNIYSHHAIGTFEVHGLLLRKYLKLGGPGQDPGSRQRLLGFPKAGQLPDELGLGMIISEFEWGKIFYKKGVGTVALYGEFYKKWKKIFDAEEVFVFGYPLTDPLPAPKTRRDSDGSYLNGQVVYFQRGCLCHYPGMPEPAVCRLSIPMLGNPQIVNTEPNPNINVKVKYQEKVFEDYGGAKLVKMLWQYKLFLKKVGTDGPEWNISWEKLPVDLPPGDLDDPVANTTAIFRPGIGGGPSAPDGTTGKTDDQPDGIPPVPRPPMPAAKVVTISGSLHPQLALEDRMLYDIGFKLTSRRRYPISPHAIYAKSSWEQFGFLHATDLHVSKRIDLFWKKLRPASLEAFNNFNDNFRDFIRYANYLHEKGELDFILATGDIIDYQYELHGGRKVTNNFAFFKELVLGESPYSEPVRSEKTQEELKVPIFINLGNHDYRVLPYELWFYVKIIDVDTPIIDIVPDKNVYQDLYKPFNLTKRDAEDIQDGRHYHFNHDDDRAIDIIRPAKPDLYRREINPLTNYIIRLGKHRIIMLDSGWDVGVVTNVWEGVWVEIAGGSEDQRSFISGEPNSRGIMENSLRVVERGMKEAGGDGLVIVGIHAPPLNPKHNEYPHYFRETEHPSSDSREISHYVVRADFGKYAAVNSGGPYHEKPDPPLTAEQFAAKYHPDWLNVGKPFFKKGLVEELLDSGVSRGEIAAFLKYSVGVMPGINYKIDLVLFGHVHRDVEYRLEWSAEEDKMRYFMDFYTENPHRYYASRKYQYNKPVHITVRPGTRINEKPVTQKNSRAFWKEWNALNIPPYDNPLNDDPDPKAWWNRHKPIFMQTAPLGPIDSNNREDRDINPDRPNPSFQGCRLLTVKDNVIHKIQHVGIAEIRKDHHIVPETPPSEKPDKVVRDHRNDPPPTPGRVVRKPK